MLGKDIDDFGPGLADFLSGEADLQKIWNTIDRNGDGYIDSREFDRLLYMCLAIWVASNSGDDVVIPKEKDLQVQIGNLRSVLMEQMDTSGDGKIDRTEFEKIGEYILMQFTKMEEGNIEHNGLNLSSIAQELCFEVKAISLLEDETHVGTTRYIAGQIVDYKADDFVMWGAFIRLHGTVLKSFDLWKKIAQLGVLLIIGYAIAKWAADATQFDIDGLRSFMEGLDALLAFFAGLYLDQILNRWWTMRSEGISGVVNAVTDLSLALAGLLHDNKPEQVQLKNIILRYGLLTHALIYAEAQEKFQNKPQHDRLVWEDFENKGLLDYKETAVLKKIRRKPEAVWGWILSYLQAAMQEGILPDDRLEHFTEICRAGRRASGLTMLHIRCQLPLPYVHLICIVVNLYQTILAFTSGMIICAAEETDLPQEIILQVARFFLYCIIYQGILETAEKMTNPLGEDDIDFPQLFIQWSLQKECKALFDLGVQMPWEKNHQKKVAAAEDLTEEVPVE